MNTGAVGGQEKSQFLDFPIGIIYAFSGNRTAAWMPSGNCDASILPRLTSFSTLFKGRG